MAEKNKTKANGDAGAAAAAPKPADKKTECPVTLEQFIEQAKPVEITISVSGGTTTLIASPRQFASGSFGYFVNDKITVRVGDTPVKVQANVNLTLVNSNPNK